METTANEITIKMLDDGDGEQLARLAQRDSAQVPFGRLLGASVDGHLVAVRSLATGSVIADPFFPSTEIQALLARRAEQLRSTNSHRGLRRLFGRRSRGALPASPPGAGGRLLTLPPRAL